MHIQHNRVCQPVSYPYSPQSNSADVIPGTRGAKNILTSGHPSWWLWPSRSSLSMWMLPLKGQIDFLLRSYKVQRSSIKKHCKKPSLAFVSTQPLARVKRRIPPEHGVVQGLPWPWQSKAMSPLTSAEMEAAVCKWASFQSLPVFTEVCILPVKRTK